MQNCGRVVSSKLLRDQDGTTRGVGFVSFAAQEDASLAIRDMDGRKARAVPPERPRTAVCPCMASSARSADRDLSACKIYKHVVVSPLCCITNVPRIVAGTELNDELVPAVASTPAC